MDLITTPGDPAANSYAEIADLRDYATTRLPAVGWVTTATDDAVTAALIAAGRILDASFDWTGAATFDEQAMCWPRSGMFSRNKRAIAVDTIPLDLKTAQCELALQVGDDDLMSDNAAIKANVSLVQAGSVEVRFQPVKSFTREAVAVEVQRLGAEFDYANVPGAVRLVIPPSWYTEHQITRPAVFRAI